MPQPAQPIAVRELERLADLLAPPCRLGEFTLDGLICKTATALVFVARGTPFGNGAGVLKLTGPGYAPLLERELRLLRICAEANLTGVVRPVRSELEWIRLEGQGGRWVAAILLPFFEGGDLVQWIATRSGHQRTPGSGGAAEVGQVVAGVLHGMLSLPHPIVHGDVKLQNVLLPAPRAPISDLVLIDLDAASEIERLPVDAGTASREVRQRLVADVNGFGELLYMLATGREPPPDGEPRPFTGNSAFDRLVVDCLCSDATAPVYASLADAGLRRDLDRAVAYERASASSRFWRERLIRPVLAVIGLILLVLLVVAVGAHFGFGV